MEYQLPEYVPSGHDYDPFSHFQAALCYLNSPNGVHADDKDYQGPLKKLDDDNSNKIFADLPFSFIDDLPIYSPNRVSPSIHEELVLGGLIQEGQSKPTSTSITELNDGHVQESESIMQVSSVEPLYGSRVP